MLDMLLLLNMVLLPLLILPMVLPLNQIMVHLLHPQMRLMVLPLKTTVLPNPLMPLHPVMVLLPVLTMVPLPLQTTVLPLLQIMVHPLHQITVHPQLLTMVHPPPQSTVHPPPQTMVHPPPQIMVHPPPQIMVHPPPQIMVHPLNQTMVHPLNQITVPHLTNWPNTLPLLVQAGHEIWAIVAIVEIIDEAIIVGETVAMASDPTDDATTDVTIKVEY